MVLGGGAKPRNGMDEVSKTGAYERTASGYHGQVEPGGKFEPEADRYHIYAAYACPWACGVLAMINLKGLGDVISVSIAHPVSGYTRPKDPKDKHIGWTFRTPDEAPVSNPLGNGAFDVDAASTPDQVNGCKTLRDVYVLNKDTFGKYTTPMLWDKKLKMIVNNESVEILRMLNSQFNHLAKHPHVDMFPPRTEALAVKLNAWIYESINNGVYRTGFARSQAAYHESVSALFDGLDRCEAILARSRFLTGDRLTWVDIRLFNTLIRFDPVYVTHFKCNRKRLADYTHLPNFVRDVYSVKGIGATFNLKHVKEHYYSSHTSIAPFAIVPEHDGFDLTSPHVRDGVRFKVAAIARRTLAPVSDG